MAFPLSHGTNPVTEKKKISTAFLIELNGKFTIYFGDTGPDYIENVDYISKIWDFIAPLIANKTLNTIMIECSFPDSQPDNMLFGHLNPKWLLNELHGLQSKVSNYSVDNLFPLSDLSVVVTHIKPSNIIYSMPDTSSQTIKQQLKDGNDMKISFVFPVQGMLLRF